MEEILDDFATYLTRQDFSPNTVVRYRRNVRLFWRWFQKERLGVEVLPAGAASLPTDEDVRAFRDKEQEKHRPAASINTYLMALRRFFAWALESGLREDDPTAAVKLLKEQRTPAPKALTAEQEEIILETARQQRAIWQAEGKGASRFTPSRDLCLLMFMSKSGLRVSEVVSILLGDLIYEQGAEAPVEVRIWGKGRKQRLVPLPRELREILVDYLQELEAGNLPAESPLFPSARTGEQITSSAAWRRVHRYAEKAGLNASPHTLRHTFGTRALRELRADIVIVADILGHSSLEITRRYTRPTDKDKRMAVEKI